MRYGILVSDLFSSMGVSPMSSLRDGTWARRPCYCSSCRVREVVPPADDPVAGDVDEGDGLRLARLEPDGRAGGDVEPAAARRVAVESKRGVRLDEVVVAAHLHRAVAEVRDFDRHRLAAGVQFDLALAHVIRT